MGALSNIGGRLGGRGLRNREEIGAGYFSPDKTAMLRRLERGYPMAKIHRLQNVRWEPNAMGMMDTIVTQT